MGLIFGLHVRLGSDVFIIWNSGYLLGDISLERQTDSVATRLHVAAHAE